MLESNIITALTMETDHLILIGDHKQLRPRNAIFELARDLKIHISLFERLIRNQMQFYQLNEQRRMRPCISSLLTPHVYGQLFNHPSVEQYENVEGNLANQSYLIV